jgi:hypothetical protein
MFPQWAEFMLSANIPEGDLDVAELQGLHVEADGGDGGHKLPLLQLAEQGGLAGTVQAQDNDPHLDLMQQHFTYNFN